jgi:hypothetical protein
MYMNVDEMRVNFRNNLEIQQYMQIYMNSERILEMLMLKINNKFILDEFRVNLYDNNFQNQ